MALPASGPISVNQVAGEFGRANNMAAFYSAASGIPASGAISLSQFHGKVNPAARYWRFYITEHNAASTCLMYEARFALTVGGAKVYPAGVAASNDEPSGPVSSINDDNVSTFWSSRIEGLGQWVRFDFSSPIAFGELRLLPYSNGTSPKSFVVQSSPDINFGSTLYSKTFSGLDGTWAGGTYKSFSL